VPSPDRQRHFRADDDGLALLADRQDEVAHQRAADVHVQRLDDLGAETGRFRRDGMRPGAQAADTVVPFGIGHDRPGRLRRAGSTVPIVFLTIHDDEELVQAAQAAGGIGYVSKTMLPSDLIVAVNEACAGRRYVSQLR
jgi:DNA-binding NarL/FixJ family response regulator